MRKQTTMFARYKKYSSKKRIELAAILTNVTDFDALYYFVIHSRGRDLPCTRLAEILAVSMHNRC